MFLRRLGLGLARERVRPKRMPGLEPGLQSRMPCRLPLDFHPRSHVALLVATGVIISLERHAARSRDAEERVRRIDHATSIPTYSFGMNLDMSRAAN